MSENKEAVNITKADIPALLSSIGELLFEVSEQAEITNNKSLLLGDYREDAKPKSSGGGRS